MEPDTTFAPTMKILSLRAILGLAIAAISITNLVAQDAPTITIRKSDSINLAVGTISGPDATTITQVLKNDLGLSGSFVLGGAGESQYVASGTSSSGGLRGEVKDRNGSVVLSKTYSGPSRSVAHQFADDIVETLTNSPGIANTKIAFVSNRTGKKEIYVADYDGANVRQLTNDGNISVAPAMSPDGRRLAYTGYQSGYADIYLVDLGSGARNRVIKFPGTNSGAAFSPDGGRIAFTASRDGNPELYVSAANGSGARRLTRTRGVESSPSWSPDGREIAYSSDDGGTSPRLFRIGSGGGDGRLISTGFAYSTEPSWSPDGHKVAFTGRSGGFVIAVTDLRSGATRTMNSGEDPAWGANSRHLMYSSGSAIMLLDTVTGRSVPVITGMGKVSEPTWSR